MIKLSPKKLTFLYVVILVYCGDYYRKFSSNFSNSKKNIDELIQVREKSLGKKFNLCIIYKTKKAFKVLRR